MNRLVFARAAASATIAALCLGLAVAFAPPAIAEVVPHIDAPGVQRVLAIKDDSVADAVITIYALDANGRRTQIHSSMVRKGATLHVLVINGTKYVLAAGVIRDAGMHKVIQPDEHQVEPPKVLNAYLRNAGDKYYWQ
jgi:hypothetical protein